MSVVIGVDGGGTKTDAVVADASGTFLGFGRSGPSNWEDVGLGGAGAAFRVAIGDSRAAVAVVAGGGSVVAGRNGRGETFRTFGLGPLFRDFSSAIDVSEEAVRAVARAYIGRGPRPRSPRRCAAGSSARRPRACSSTCPVATSTAASRTRSRTSRSSSRPPPETTALRGDPGRRGPAHGSHVVLVAARLGILREPFDVVLAGGFLAAAGALVTAPLDQVVGSRPPTFVHASTPPVAPS